MSFVKYLIQKLSVNRVELKYFSPHSKIDYQIVEQLMTSIIDPQK